MSVRYVTGAGQRVGLSSLLGAGRGTTTERRTWLKGLERLDHRAVRRAQLRGHHCLGAAADLPQVHVGVLAAQDADGVTHPGVIHTPLPILVAPRE